MLEEQDYIVLTEDMPGKGLKAGDVGVIIHIHGQEEAFEVEFSALDGSSLAVATVLASQARPGTGYDVKHARKIELDCRAGITAEEKSLPVPFQDAKQQMLKELDRVVLTADVTADIDGGDLKAGDVGTIVHMIDPEEAFIVEFLTLDIYTAAVATVLASQARPVTGHDVSHSRKVTKIAGASTPTPPTA